MSWLTHHQTSEEAASEAHAAQRRGEDALATSLFADAAKAELLALKHLSLAEKPRTFGVTAVSAAALLYKAEQPREAEQLAHSMLGQPGLPEFATDQLREILQSIWNEQAQASAGVRFVPGQVTVSVDGGEVVKGGAPLDLVVERVQTIQSIFYRTAEFLKNLPLRRHGPATKPIQDLCRPWLFQSVPGSYQFTVAIQGPAQGDMFEEGEPEPRLVASTFMAILEGAASDPETNLPKIVPDAAYRETFLKLARNLAPTGRSFSHLELRSTSARAPVVLTQESRKSMTNAIRGNAEFTRDFTSKGPKDKHGRSLRDFDLQTRLFRYPCSYLIYSDAFNSLPASMKELLYSRLWEILVSKDSGSAFASLTPSTRRSIREILIDTKADLPAYWREKDLPDKGEVELVK